MLVSEKDNRAWNIIRSLSKVGDSAMELSLASTVANLAVYGESELLIYLFPSKLRAST
jgi:hypothetical protein